MPGKEEIETEEFTKEEIEEIKEKAKEYIEECLSKGDWDDKTLCMAMDAYTFANKKYEEIIKNYA